jgi:hypothetical protein
MPSNTENFKIYPNGIFIETGSFMGDGIQQSLDAGFNKIISIELSEKYHNIASARFNDDPRVTVLFGDSYLVLPEVLREIDEPVTFWLDGHHSCGDTALGDYWSPLIKELEAIEKHHIKNHTILIDDMRCWKEPNDVHGFYEKDIMDKIKKINPNYRMTFLNGAHENDILAAFIDHVR